MTKPTKKGKTLGDLAALHDKKVLIPNRIRAALKILADSGDDWIYEADFLQLTKPGLSPPDVAKYRDQFADFWAEMPATNGKSTMRRVWFASVKLANNWKETAGG
jgi:hypothetical protein